MLSCVSQQIIINVANFLSLASDNEETMEWSLDDITNTSCWEWFQRNRSYHQVSTICCHFIECHLRV